MVTFVIDSVDARLSVLERVDSILHLHHRGEIFLDVSQLSVAEVARVILHITRRAYIDGLHGSVRLDRVPDNISVK